MLCWMQEQLACWSDQRPVCRIEKQMRRFTGFLNKIALKDSTFRHLSILTDDERKKMAMAFLQASILPALCWCYTQQNEQQSFSSQDFEFFFWWVGELFITHTWTCNERNHKCQTEAQPKRQATLTTWVEADTKVCKEATCQAKQAAHKAVVHQPTAKPVHFQQPKHHLCLNQPNIAVKITTSRAYDVHCKPKGSSPHHNLNQRMKHTRESTAHIRACHRACQKSN